MTFLGNIKPINHPKHIWDEFLLNKNSRLIMQILEILAKNCYSKSIICLPGLMEFKPIKAIRKILSYAISLVY